MKLKASIFGLTLTVLVFLSCKKSNDEYCWQILDRLGNPVNSVCNKTESEMQASYPIPCSYYKLGDNFCWFINGAIFIKDVPEDYINRLTQCYDYTSVLKVPCDYCQSWYSRQKSIYKPTNEFTFSPVLVQQYCGDTVHTLFQGRQIILKETADSLMIVEFSNNRIF